MMPLRVQFSSPSLAASVQPCLLHVLHQSSRPYCCHRFSSPPLSHLDAAGLSCLASGLPSSPHCSAFPHSNQYLKNVSQIMSHLCPQTKPFLFIQCKSPDKGLQSPVPLPWLRLHSLLTPGAPPSPASPPQLLTLQFF